MGKGISPTARSLKQLRAEGFIAQVVEKTIPHCFIKKDLFGCIDIIACKPGVGTVGIQATSGSNHAARMTKALAIPELKIWCDCGNTFQVWSWSKPKDSRKWTLRREAGDPRNTTRTS